MRPPRIGCDVMAPRRSFARWTARPYSGNDGSLRLFLLGALVHQAHLRPPLPDLRTPILEGPRLTGERAAQNSDHRIQPPPPNPRIARDLLIREICAVSPVRPIGRGTHAQDRKAGGQND